MPVPKIQKLSRPLHSCGDYLPGHFPHQYPRDPFEVPRVRNALISELVARVAAECESRMAARCAAVETICQDICQDMCCSLQKVISVSQATEELIKAELKGELHQQRKRPHSPSDWTPSSQPELIQFGD